MKLEDGKIYETSEGIGVCKSQSDYFKINGCAYGKDGSPFLPWNPKILYKLKVNEPPEPDFYIGFGLASDKADCMAYFFSKDEMVDAIKALKPMPVLYHREVFKNRFPCFEPSIPDGYEVVKSGEIRTTDMHRVSDNGETWVGVPHAIIPDNLLVIRPVKKPFRIDGPGWYKTALGDWAKLTEERLSKTSMISWAKNTDIMIAKATPEQSRILDAL